MQTLLHKFFAALRGPGFTVRYWDGSSHIYGQGEECFRIIFRTAAAGRGMVLDPYLGFGEGYMNGDIEVEGNLDALMDLAHQNAASLKGGLLLRWWQALTQWLPVSASERKRHVQHHYDLGNDFYRLWLDPTLTYSCAYFRSSDQTLHQAQLDKIDHILCKLRLRPSDLLLDIGCGWGQLLVRAVQMHGVRALGITLSREQCAAGQQMLAELALSGQAEIRLQSYHDLVGSGQRFDRIVSVGMFEHVGRPQIPLFMKRMSALLVPGGLGLLHTITRPVEGAVNAWTRRYIFPGGYIPSWREVVAGLAGQNLRLLDAEDLRPHYALTLKHWAASFSRCEEEIRSRYGDRFVRMWRLYLHSSAAAFQSGTLHLHQFLVSQGIAPDFPLTRQFMYAGGNE